MSHSRFTSRDKIFFYFTTEPSTLSFPAIYRMLATNKPNNGQTLYRVHCTASKRIIYYSNVVINPCQHFSIFHNRANYAIYVSSAAVLWSTLRDAMQVEGGGMGGREVVHTPQSPTSCTTFTQLQYYCGTVPPDSRPSWYYSRLQVNKMNQKSGFMASCANVKFWTILRRFILELVVFINKKITSKLA